MKIGDRTYGIRVPTGLYGGRRCERVTLARLGWKNVGERGLSDGGTVYLYLFGLSQTLGVIEI